MDRTLPDFDTPGTAARTDYLIDGKHEATVFLTAAKSNKKKAACFALARPMAARLQAGFLDRAGERWLRDYAVFRAALAEVDPHVAATFRAEWQQD